MSDEYRLKLEAHLKRIAESDGTPLVFAYDEQKEPIRCGVGRDFSVDDPDFNDACEWHDKAYTMDSWAEHNLTRYQVDRVFLKYMLDIAGRNPLTRARAYAYYYFARLFGGKYWEGDQ